jgi:hypothetical protein
MAGLGRLRLGRARAPKGCVGRTGNDDRGESRDWGMAGAKRVRRVAIGTQAQVDVAWSKQEAKTTSRHGVLFHTGVRRVAPPASNRQGRRSQIGPGARDRPSWQGVRTVGGTRRRRAPP